MRAAADFPNPVPVASQLARPCATDTSTPTLAFPKLSYSVDEAAEATSFSSTTIWEAIGKGGLPAKRRGRRTYILVNELVRWLEAGDDVETRQ